MFRLAVPAKTETRLVRRGAQSVSRVGGFRPAMTGSNCLFDTSVGKVGQSVVRGVA